MYKKASENSQRVSIKLAVGLTVPGGDGRGPSLAPIEQARITAAKRLARIRRVFELEQEISKGRNVAHNRQEIELVRNGHKDVDLRLAYDPRPSDTPSVTVARRDGPERQRLRGSDGVHGKRPTITEKGVFIDLADIAKGKLTPSGIALVKVLLDRFDIQEISEALGTPMAFLEKAALHPVYRLASALQAADGLIIVSVLEKQLSSKPG